jgi:hypothetical protein
MGRRICRRLTGRWIRARHDGRRTGQGPSDFASGKVATVFRDGRRLDHAEAASKPLRSHPEPQPRGAKVHPNRPIDQAEAVARFIAAPEHEKMHDERIWDLRDWRRLLRHPSNRSSRR